MSQDHGDWIERRGQVIHALVDEKYSIPYEDVCRRRCHIHARGAMFGVSEGCIFERDGGSCEC